MKKPLLLALLLLLLLAGRGLAQTRTITGRVLDQTTNEGLPGVSVLLKGTTTGTATGADGTYSLPAPAEATTLQFKYLGYVTVERPIGPANAVDVTLSVDAKELNEVVITASNIARQERELGYSAGTIRASQLVQKAEPDVLRALAAKEPGVNVNAASSAPGGSTRITIRGNNSITKSNGPLFVVDGVPYDNGQEDSDNAVSEGTGAYSNRAVDIDPNNIASMTILKGAAASALYGSRASGGVIVITTKNGGGQRGPKGIAVGYTMSYITERVILPEYQNKYGSGAATSSSLYTNGSWGPRFGSPEAPDSIQLYGVVQRRGLNATLRTPYQPYPNNVQDFFQTGRLWENSVSVTSTGENASFTAVLSRSDNTGAIPNSSFIRNNVSVGGSGTFQKLTIGGNMAYTNSAQRSPQIGSSQAAGGASLLSRLLFMPRNMNLQGNPTTNPVDNSSDFAWLTAQADNPIWAVNNNSYTSQVDRTVLSLTGQYAFTDWLRLSYIGGVNTYSEARRNTTRAGGTSKYPTGRILEDNLRNTELDQTVLLTFDKQLTENISLKAILGNNVNQRQFELASFEGTGIIEYGIDNISNTQNQVQHQYGQRFRKRRLVGVFGDVTVGYRNWAFLNVTGRNDFSSTLNIGGDLARGTGRGFFYPGVSGSVIVNEALNLTNVAWLSLIKLRGSYARVGNDADAYDAGRSTFQINPQTYGGNGGGLVFPFNGTSGVALSPQVRNPGLTPEFTNEWETGLEAGFFKRRIYLNATYYDRRTTNQIAEVSLPTATGYGSEFTNFGEISNKGIEAGLTLVPLQLAGFQWTTTVNFTRNRNIVERLTKDDDRILLANSFASPQSVLIPGQPYGVTYGTALARDPATNLPLINATTGLPIVATANKVIGNPNPDYVMGFINTFSYKGLSLSSVLDFRKGGTIYSSTLQSLLGRGVTRDTEDRDRVIIVKGILGDPATKLPLLTDPSDPGSTTANVTPLSLNEYYFTTGEGSAAIGGAAEQQIYDATILRLRELTLGYELPKSLLAKTPFSTISLALVGRNLYRFTPNIPRYSNFDPETSSYSSGSNGLGIEFLTTPPSRRYGITLRAAF